MNPNTNPNLRAPITFLNDKIAKVADLNRSFMIPYELGLISSEVNSRIVDEKKDYYFNTCKENDDKYFDKYNESFRIQMNDVKEVEENILSSNIRHYIIQNATDLIYNSLLRFISDVFYVDLRNGLGAFLIFDPDRISSMVSSSIFINPRYKSLDDININLNENDSAIISRVCSIVYEGTIVNNLHMLIKEQPIGFETLFKIYYTVYFDKEYDKKADLPPIDHMYTFLSSMMRDRISNYIIELNTALIYMSSTVMNMLVNRLDYYLPEHVSDPTYNTNTSINNNAEYRRMLGVEGTVPSEYSDCNDVLKATEDDTDSGNDSKRDNSKYTHEDFNEDINELLQEALRYGKKRNKFRYDL